MENKIILTSVHQSYIIFTWYWCIKKKTKATNSSIYRSKSPKRDIRI